MEARLPRGLRCDCALRACPVVLAECGPGTRRTHMAALLARETRTAIDMPLPWSGATARCLARIAAAPGRPAGLALLACPCQAGTASHGHAPAAPDPPSRRERRTARCTQQARRPSQGRARAAPAPCAAWSQTRALSALARVKLETYLSWASRRPFPRAFQGRSYLHRRQFLVQNNGWIAGANCWTSEAVQKGGAECRCESTNTMQLDSCCLRLAMAR